VARIVVCLSGESQSERKEESNGGLQQTVTDAVGSGVGRVSGIEVDGKGGTVGDEVGGLRRDADDGADGADAVSADVLWPRRRGPRHLR